MLRILALSDIHGRTRYIKLLKNRIDKEIDYIIVAGDLTHFGTLNDAERILEILREALNTPILFVPGNCDPKELLNVNNIGRDILNIHEKITRIDEYLFFGIGGSTITPFNTNIEFTEDEINNKLTSIKNEDHRRLVMVTHSPPYGILDKTLAGINAGSKTLRKFLEEKHPLLWIVGHIHEARGMVKKNNTILINPGPLSKGYYAYITIDKGKVDAYLGKVK